MSTDDKPVGFMILANGSPFSSATAQGMLPGSQLVVANCGHTTWVSPGGLHLLDTVYTLCVSCDLASEVPAVFSHAEQSYTVPGAVRDVERVHGTGKADQLRAFMRDVGIKEL